MEELSRICEQAGLPLVEDCSHAHGATINGRKVGTFGTAACFSLEGHKPIVAGEGGALVTWSREVYERALMLGHFGKRVKEEVAAPELRPFVQTGFGQKYRMHRSPRPSRTSKSAGSTAATSSAALTWSSWLTC